MRTFTCLFALPLIFVLPACPDDDDTGSGSGTDTSPTTSTSGTGSGSGSSSAGGSTGGSTGGPETSGGSSTSTSTGGAGGICDPAETDQDCDTCIKTMCCADLETCAANTECGCAVNCVSGGGDFLTCATDCGADASNPAVIGIGSCFAGACLAACTP